MGTAGTALLRGLALLAAPTLAAGSLGEPEVCYVLDAVLFLYGLILTGLYCRLRLAARRWRPAAPRGKEKEEAVYADLSSGHQEPYETLQMKPSSPSSSPSDPLGTPPDPPLSPRDPSVTPP